MVKIKQAIINYFDPFKEERKALDNAPTCCNEPAKFVNMVRSTFGDKYFFQCDKCKKLFILSPNNLTGDK
jgi:hypothetical protein